MQAEADGFAKEKSENGGRGGDIFFESKSGGGENLLQSRIARAQPSQIPAGGKKGPGGGDGFRSAGQIHGLSEEGDAESCAQVFGIQQGSREFRQGRGALAGGQEDFFLEGVKTDGKEKSGGQGDGASEGEGQGRSFQE